MPVSGGPSGTRAEGQSSFQAPAARCERFKRCKSASSGFLRFLSGAAIAPRTHPKSASSALRRRR
eukprot:2288268-Alexandrium_andersonii.AAC.1